MSTKPHEPYRHIIVRYHELSETYTVGTHQMSGNEALQLFEDLGMLLLNKATVEIPWLSKPIRIES